MIPLSNTILKNETYIGSIIFDVYFMCSFIISSFAELLLFFNIFIHFNISPSVMNEFRISSSLLISILKVFLAHLLQFVHLGF